MRVYKHTTPTAATRYSNYQAQPRLNKKGKRVQGQARHVASQPRPTSTAQCVADIDKQTTSRAPCTMCTAVAGEQANTYPDAKKSIMVAKISGFMTAHSASSFCWYGASVKGCG